MKKLTHDPVSSTKIRLRLIEKNDIEMTRCWRNQDHIRTWFNSSEIIQAKQQENWFNHYQNLPNDYTYIIECKNNNNHPIGQIGIYKIDFNKKSAEFGRLYIGEKVFESQGLAEEASRILIEFWKKNYGICHFHLVVKSNNLRAISLYKKLGFKQIDIQNDCLVMAME